MASANLFAEWIVRYRADNGAPVDRLSLQKLLFYAQAFHLARHGEPLFAENFEAWIHGPVVPQVWRAYASDGDRTLRPSPEQMAPHQVDDEAATCLGETVQFFSRVNRFTLSDATHNEDPWRLTRAGRPPHERSGETIPLELIRRFYANLIDDGEMALSRREVLHLVPEPRIGMYYKAGICARKMLHHPFYDLELAEFLLAPVGENAPFPRSWYAPVTTRDFLPAEEL